jgi:hypothetical protein
MRNSRSIIIAIAVVVAGVAVVAVLAGGSSRISSGPSSSSVPGEITLPSTTTTTTTQPVTKKEVATCSQSAAQLSTFLRNHPKPVKGGDNPATISTANALYGTFVTDCKTSPVIVSVVTRVQVNPWRKRFGLSALAVPSVKP